MRIKAVLNRDGGTFRTTDLEAYQTRARDIFARNGHQLDIAAVSGADLRRSIDRAIQSTPDALLAGGGDGTISTAAASCWRSGIPLGVLPAGTMNLFARSLDIPPDPELALDALASGQIRSVDIATANGTAFIHQFSIGFHARMVRMRERMEFSSRIGKIVASTRALVATIFDPPSFPIHFRLADAEVETARVSTVSVANNLFGDGHLPYADDPSGGVLGVYMHPELGLFEGFRFAWKAARGRLGEIENLRISSCGRIELEFPRYRRGAIAIIDGEIHPLGRRVEIVSHKGGLQVLAPREAVTPEAVVDRI